MSRTGVESVSWTDELGDKRQLEGEARRVLEPLLVSRGFNVFGTLHIGIMNDGFVLTQIVARRPVA